VTVFLRGPRERFVRVEITEAYNLEPINLPYYLSNGSFGLWLGMAREIV
jgi:hypothetical protein